MEKSRKKFIKLPTLGGGKDVLKKFLADNMVYPDEALKNNIEGDVIIEYRVNNLGEVLEAHVVHGIGHGCDEEALRLVRMLKYQEVRNRGIKVTTNNKIKIPFRIGRKVKAPGINISYVSSKASGTKSGKQPEKSEKTYTYSIRLGS